MDWFIFVLITLTWLTSLAFFLEKKTVIRSFITGALFFFVGAILITDGISYPTGWTIVTTGSTQVITQNFTNTSSTASWMSSLGYGIFFFGFFFLIEVWTYMLTMGASAVDRARDRFGI